MLDNGSSSINKLSMSLYITISQKLFIGKIHSKEQK